MPVHLKWEKNRHTVETTIAAHRNEKVIICSTDTTVKTHHLSSTSRVYGCSANAKEALVGYTAEKSGAINWKKDGVDFPQRRWLEIVYAPYLVSPPWQTARLSVKEQLCPYIRVSFHSSRLIGAHMRKSSGSCTGERGFAAIYSNTSLDAYLTWCITSLNAYKIREPPSFLRKNNQI